jgi:hypothetical protein
MKERRKIEPSHTCVAIFAVAVSFSSTGVASLRPPQRQHHHRTGLGRLQEIKEEG